MNDIELKVPIRHNPLEHKFYIGGMVVGWYELVRVWSDKSNDSYETVFKYNGELYTNVGEIERLVCEEWKWRVLRAATQLDYESQLPEPTIEDDNHDRLTA
jgi:hypothetical protein